jgi:uncharacterized protein YecT (DUF1311 family)
MPTPADTFWRVTLLLACSLATISGQTGQDTFPGCKKYKNVPIPREDQPTPEQAKALADCSSADLYYGFDHPAAPVKARLCAYAESAREENGVLVGKSILTMIYANGRGATRNFDLALRFACEANAFPGESERRIPHLEQLKAQNWSGSDFDFCDDIGDSMFAAFCSEKDYKFAAAKRRKQLNAILAKWSNAERQAFVNLQKAASAFFESRQKNEVDQSGTSRYTAAFSEQSELEESFFSALSGFEAAKMPNFTSAGFTKADTELNAAYAKALKLAARPGRQGTINVDGIRETERLWLKYLVAWVAFARQKYPQVTADSWRGWLTEERTKQLQDLLLDY